MLLFRNAYKTPQRDWILIRNFIKCKDAFLNYGFQESEEGGQRETWEHYLVVEPFFLSHIR